MVLTQGEIVGELKEPHAENQPDEGRVAPPEKKTPWHLSDVWAWFTQKKDEMEAARKRAAEEKDRHFTVTRVEDRELVGLLQAAGVEYRGKIE